MSDNVLPAAFQIGSILLALTGLYFVIRVWLKWKYIDMDLLKARVFLNKKFLERNWIYVFLAGASLTAHQALGLLGESGFIETSYSIYLVSEILEFATLAFLVVLAYEWFKVLYYVKIKKPGKKLRLNFTW
jgi:hypothetical protein